MSEMKDILAFVGFEIEGNRCFLPNSNELEVVNHLEIANQELDAKEMSLVKNEDIPFEEVIFNDNNLDENETLTQEGPKLVKTMGDNRGLSNSVSLALFLAIDVVAIFVGLFLLMH